jgi:hypothetical protein
MLRVLPTPPGSQQLSVQHNPYFRERGPLSGIPIGWTTNVTYRAPAGMTANDVIEFYLLNMPDAWLREVERVPVIDLLTGMQTGKQYLHAAFTWGGGLVAVNTDNMEAGGPHTFELAVDYRGVRP